MARDTTTQREGSRMNRGWNRRAARPAVVLVLALLCLAIPAWAQGAKIVQQDYQIDALDPGIKLFVRMKMAEGNTHFANDNIVLFVHGATFPSTR